MQTVRMEVLGWLLLMLLHFTCTAAPACKSQGLLMLDEPYPPPYRIKLPFCDKYQCSCCNASHALTIQRAVRSVMLDEDLSMACKAALISLACRLCDPRVGVGNVTTICASTCDEVFQACSLDFFAFDESSSLMMPCTSHISGQLVCSQLTQLVSNGTDMCKAAGYSPALSDSPPGTCFDGSPVGLEQCDSAPPRRSSSSSSSSDNKRQYKSSRRRSWRIWPLNKLKARHMRMLLEAAQVVVGATASAIIALGVVLLLQRLMQPAVAASEASGFSRTRLAQAAEARAAAGVRSGGAVSRPAATTAQQLTGAQAKASRRK